MNNLSSIYNGTKSSIPTMRSMQKLERADLSQQSKKAVARSGPHEDTVRLSPQAMAAYVSLHANEKASQNNSGLQESSQKAASTASLFSGPGSKAISKGFDLSRVMKIHENSRKEMPNQADTDYYWAARKSDPELDQALYDADKARVLQEVAQIQNLLLKATLSPDLKEGLTEKEIKQIQDDPDLKREITMRRSEMSLVKEML